MLVNNLNALFTVRRRSLKTQLKNRPLTLLREPSNSTLQKYKKQRQKDTISNKRVSVLNYAQPNAPIVGRTRAPQALNR